MRSSDKEISRSSNSARSTMTESPSLRQLRQISSQSSLSSSGERPLFTEIDYNELHFLSDTPLGKGAFGVVFPATWRGAKVAVKRLMAFLDADELANFRQEAALMQHVCNHPNIVNFIGASTKFEKYAIVTQYCDRGSVFDELIKRQAKWPVPRLVRMLRDAAAGVLHLHKEHVIHRDIAARNFLLDRMYNVYVTDFGLSRIKLAGYAHTNSSMGPVKHMAPEAIKKRYSEKSDAFAFGTFIWECTHQDEPFKGMEVFEVATGVVDGSLRPVIDAERMHPKLLRDDVLPQMMIRCWKADEAERPTFTEICNELLVYNDKIEEYFDQLQP